MDHAIVAIEDKRFYTESGVDIRGIARAFITDVFHTGSGTQGASTITEQFVKNALSQRGPPHDLREAQGGGARLPAEPPVAEERDPRRVPQHRLLRQRRARHRGGGARLLRQRPGIEPLDGCGKVPNYNDPASLCVTYLTADEAALLAGMVASPTTLGNDLFYNVRPVDERDATSCCATCAQQGYLTLSEYSD